MSLDALRASPPWVALDTETSGLHWDDGARVACVSVTYPEINGELVTYAFPFDQGERDKFPTTQLDFDFGGQGADPNLGRAEWDELLRWLSQQALVYHNAKFDTHMVRVGTRHWPGIDLIDNFHWDTMLVQGVLDPKELRGLDSTVRRLGVGTGKASVAAVQEWLKRHKYPKHRYDLVPWAIIEPYVTTDTEDTARLYIHQQERLETLDELGSDAPFAQIEREYELLVALYRMEQRGIGYDDARSLAAAEILDQRAQEIEDRLPFPATPKGAKKYFIDKLGLVADRHSEKTGEPSVDEEQVRKWAREDVSFATEYAQATKIRRAVSMWYRGYPEKIGHDGRLRCTFRQGHVKSGRMSVERVQLQALPKADKYNVVGSTERLEMYQDIPDVRDLIQAKEGHGLWNLDLSQAELRVAAHYAKCRRMQEMLARGVDMHGETTKGTLKVAEDHPQWKEKRDIAKRLTFGGIFQIGGKTFQSTLSKLADIHLPLEECYDMTNAWRSMYPEFGYAYRKADQMAQERGYVRLLPNTPYEIRSYFKDHEFTNTAWNRIVQGSLAEAFKQWLGWIEREHPGYLILTIHDSVVLEAPLDEGDQLGSRVAEYGAALMTELFGTTMKVDVDRW